MKENPQNTYERPSPTDRLARDRAHLASVRELAAPRAAGHWARARYQIAVCECGRVCGEYRCEVCRKMPYRMAEMRLTEASALLLTLADAGFHAGVEE